MRVGLVRHFKVELPFPSGWRTAHELLEWRNSYDRCATTECKVDLGPEPWSRCLCSDLPRAVTTAKALFSGPIEQTALLREVEFGQPRTGNLRLPLFAWQYLLRLTWLAGHGSQRAVRDEFRRRVSAAADALEERSGHVLAVSHAGVMMFLSAELRRRGFSGPKLRRPENARLYLYQKNS